MHLKLSPSSDYGIPNRKLTAVQSTVALKICKYKTDLVNQLIGLKISFTWVVSLSEYVGNECAETYAWHIPL